MSKKKRERLAKRIEKGNRMMAVIFLFVIVVLSTLLIERVTVAFSVSGLTLALIAAVAVYCWMIRDDS